MVCCAIAVFILVSLLSSIGFRGKVEDSRIGNSAVSWRMHEPSGSVSFSSKPKIARSVAGQIPVVVALAVLVGVLLSNYVLSRSGSIEAEQDWDASVDLHSSWCRGVDSRVDDLFGATK